MGMIERISEADAARDLAGLLERVRTQGVCFEIVSGDKVVARLEPPAPTVKTVADLIEALRAVPQLTVEDSAAWEKDLADIRKELPMQNREWD